MDLPVFVQLHVEGGEMLLDSCQRLLVMDLHYHQTHLTDVVVSERQRLIRVMTGHK